jgi:hypothetical protein
MIASSVYCYGATILIPTMGRTEFGFYRLVEPVEVLHQATISNLSSALRRAKDRGNPDVSAGPSNQAKERTLLVRYSHAASRHEFERRASVWDVDWMDDRIFVTPNRRAILEDGSNEQSGYLEMPEAKREFGVEQLDDVAAWLLEHEERRNQRGIDLET